MPVSPFDTQCGYLDRDGDGLLDWAETELAWVFRPYLIMDHSEEWAGNASMSNVNGITLMYQAHPEEITDPEVRRIKVQIIFLFRTDRYHAGDTEAINMVLSSRRGDSGQFLQWRLFSISYRHCGEGARKKCLEPEPGCGDLIQHLELHGFFEDGSDCSSSHEGTGVCLPPVYISKGKHGLYESAAYCDDDCLHGGGGYEECNGGWQGASCYGLPASLDVEGSPRLIPPGFLGALDYYQTALQEHPEWISKNMMYLGNIGEIQIDPFEEEWSFIAISFLGAADKIGHCVGSHTFLVEKLNDLQSQYFLSQIISVPIEGNSKYIFYPSEKFESNQCYYWPDWRFQKGSLDPSMKHRKMNDLLMGEDSVTGVLGLYGTYSTEAIVDSEHGEFCGGKRSSFSSYCDDVSFGSEPGAPIHTKLMRLPHSWRIPQQCHSMEKLFYDDRDQDGAPDEFDCEPLNPYLIWDLDQDGHCDLPVAHGDEATCQEVCATLYFNMTHWSEAYIECALRCQGPHDNCSPLVNRFGVPYYDQNEASQCRALMQKFDGQLLWRCQRWFENPDQADHNHNGVGDRCERGITAVRAEVRPETYGMNLGYFSWCPDPTATVSAFLSRDRSFLTGGMLSVGLCVCPGQTEASCRDDSTEPKTLYCPSDPVEDDVSGEDYSMKDFAWDSRNEQYKYFYHPLEATTQRDLGVLTSNSTLRGEVRQGYSVPDQGLLARWRDVLFENVRVFLTFRTDRFREFPGFSTATMLETFPSETVVPTHDRYSKLKFSSPQILEPEAINNPSHPFRIPTHETWNPEAPTAEYALLHAPPGTFYFNPEEDDVCIRFPRPVGQPVGYTEGSPLPVDPLWDPPRELHDPLFGWIPDEDGAWRLFGVDPVSFQVRSYVALPSGLDLRETELRFLRVDAALVGGAAGTWSTVAAALDRGALYLRDPLQPGSWTQVPTGIPANQTILAFHQATPETAWVISRRNLITAPTLQEVHLASGAILRQQTLPDWTFVRVESMASPRMGEAYFLLKRPAHLLPNLWKLDHDGLRSDLSLPALVPPERGALAVDGRMGKLYLVARAAADRKASLWVHDLVTKTWRRLSAAVPVSVPREPRLALSGERLVFSDLKDGRWWEWTQGRWIDLGNPLTREVGP